MEVLPPDPTEEVPESVQAQHQQPTTQALAECQDQSPLEVQGSVSKPVTLQTNETAQAQLGARLHGPILPGPQQQSPLPDACQPQPMRPTILQPKSSTQKPNHDPANSSNPITLGSIVTAHGITTLKVSPGTMNSQPATLKVPNIIRSQQNQGAHSQPLILNQPGQPAIGSSGEQTFESSGPYDAQNSVQIFSVSGMQNNDPQQNLVCLNIVDGKIQNIVDSSNGSSSTSQNIGLLPTINVLKPLDDIKGKDDIKIPREKNLRKSGLQISMNEFNALEIQGEIKIETDKDPDNVDLSCTEVALPSPRKDGGGIFPKVKDDILCCGGCGCYGMAGEFLDNDACSSDCKQRIALKIKEKEKKEREIQAQKARREAKKREKEAKEAEEKRQRDLQGQKENEGQLKYQTLGGPPHQPPSGSASEDSNDHFDEFHPWKEGGGSFSWESYLQYSQAKPAPSKLFQCAFPPEDNPFQVGQKLEAIDPERPSLICVVTIVEIKGYRIRLHFDGYSESYDFWENANSSNIFPSGFCAAHKQALMPPKKMDPKEFKWATYLKQTESKAAPKEAFRNRPESVDISGWRVGQKLEAVDRQNASLVCVASVSNILDGRILVHFDGWEVDFDYWTRPTSPYIHPVGWCDQNGAKLNPPKGYSGNFSWDKYLKETFSLPVPAWSFKPPRSEVSLFRKGMKLEAVDKRNPSIIRVASVVDVLMHQIKLNFDGWPSVYDYWVEDNSQDIHPPTWCSKTKHPLMPPLTTEEVKYFESRGGCTTPGCRGIGHVKGAKYSCHFTTAVCPYAPHNLDNENLIPDRLQWYDKSNNEANVNNVDDDDDFDDDDQDENHDRNKSGSSLGRGNRKRKPRKFFDEVQGQESLNQSGQVPSRPISPVNSKSRRLSNGIGSSNIRLNLQDNNNHTEDKNHVNSNQPLNVIQSNLPNQPVSTVRSTVFQPQHSYYPTEVPILAWETNSAFLKQQVGGLSTNEVFRWSPRQVAQFISSLPGIRSATGEDICQRIIEEEIDGEAFLLLTQFDLVKMLGLKLGPAIKVFNVILLISAGGHRESVAMDCR